MSKARFWKINLPRDLKIFRRETIFRIVFHNYFDLIFLSLFWCDYVFLTHFYSLTNTSFTWNWNFGSRLCVSRQFVKADRDNPNWDIWDGVCSDEACLMLKNLLECWSPQHTIQTSLRKKLAYASQLSGMEFCGTPNFCCWKGKL